MQRRDEQIMKGECGERRLKGVELVKAQPQKCPRCDSVNTKFCYYNNYSLSQPRYLCKTCRRYWTHGGTLRNVPVGGGCRKPKRPPKQSSHSSHNSNSQSAPPPPPLPLPPPQHLIFSGTPVITPSSSYFNPPGEEQLGSSSSWVNSFGSSQSQGQCQIQASEIFEMMDQSAGKAAVHSPAAWPQSYINDNSISNPMDAVGDAIVWTTGNSDAGSGGVNPTNNNTTVMNQWPDYMPGFCPPP